MLALQIVEQGQPLQRREVPRPTCSSEGVLIEVKAAGICRSDVHYMDNTHKLGPLVSLFAVSFPKIEVLL